MTIRGSTTLVGIIGSPVAHSFSPQMHNAAFAALGMDWAYVPFAVAPVQLATAIAGARALNLRGLNVTLPHKQNAMLHCVPDALAQRVGAINTIVFDDVGEPHGTNTDVHGFAAQLDELGISGRRLAVIVGAGGAARAVVDVVAARGWRYILTSRRAGELRVGSRVDKVNPLHLLDAATLRHCDLLIDTTPRALTGEAPLVDPARLDRAAWVIDLVARGSTPLTVAAEAAGRRAATGISMLLHQGARSFELWTGRAPPLEAMRKALGSVLAAVAVG